MDQTFFDNLPIFSKPFWLDAVAPNTWNAVSLERDGRIIAYFPYVMRTRCSFTMLDMPYLTPYLGLYLLPSDGNSPFQHSAQRKLVTELISQLPPFDYFNQFFHYSMTDHLPFHWNGFSQTTCYTFIIENLEDLDKVFRNFTESVKSSLRKAEKQVTVVDHLTLRDFYDLNAMTFARQGLRIPYPYAFLERIDTACAANNARKLFFAVDAKDQTHAGIYVIYDKTTSYLLMAGGNPDLRQSGAGALLIREAIKFASTVSKGFDFEGSMVKGIEQHYRAFGARQTPYFNISKCSSKCIRIYKDVKSWFAS